MFKTSKNKCETANLQTGLSLTSCETSI